MKHTKKVLIFLFILIIFLSTLNISFASTISIDSESAILVETSTDRILYEKNAYKRMYPASTTKIMTAILTIENCELTDIATVNQNALQSIPAGYVTCKLQLGEQLSIKDLLYALMVLSANDAAVVLAEHISGSVESFSDMMNEKAKEIGCVDTHFVNPNGIHNDNHYSTAYDLYLIGKYGMKNEFFRTLVSTTSYTLPDTNNYPYTDRTFTTTNELIKINTNDRPDNYYYKYANGIKTGYTSQAKNCLVSSSSRDGLNFISVVLHAETTDTGLSQRYLDTINLLNYGYDNFTLTKIKESNMIITTIEIENATKETKKLDLLIRDSITVINNKSTDTENLLQEIILDENLQAPISKGDSVGIIKYLVDDIEYSSDLLASVDVYEKTDISIYILSSGLVLLLFAILIFPKKKKIRKNFKKGQLKSNK